ncbi:MAG TPA: GlmU family protein [Bacteroidota bacterium]|nr:GlmU family protein [Bacteroidota bacterium]
MAPTICLFEDNHATRLLPLVYFRPVYNLKCGILSLKEKILHVFPKAVVTLHCRGYLTEYMRLRNPDFRVNELPTGDTLFLNGRTIVDEALAKQLSDGRDDHVFMAGDDVVAARVQASNLGRVRGKIGDPISAGLFDGMPRSTVNATMISYPWDLVRHNGDELVKDFGRLMKRVKGKRIRGDVSKGAHVLGRNDIYVGEGACVNPGVVLDAEEGPIYIGKKARIFPQATILGPVSVGDQSWVKVGAQIYEHTSIGPLSKVGGEVEETIIHGYSNKQHGGFLGHAYIGAWVNLGADTNNSDLKNNYGNVRVSIGDELVDTGMQFVGLTMGDHSKSAINSMFNTGTVVGASCNIFGYGFPPKYVPSFSWGAAGETFTTYGVDKAIDVARRVMSRRKVALASPEERLFKKVFELTSDERRRRGMPA